MRKTTLSLVALAAFALAGCGDSALLDPVADAPDAPLGPQGPALDTHGPLPFHMQISSNDIRLTLWVIDDALSEDADQDPDLVTVEPATLLYLMKNGLSLFFPWKYDPDLSTDERQRYGQLLEYDGRCGQPSMAVMAFSFEGTATHMGRITGTGGHCFYEPGSFGEGRSTVIAANGDELWASYDNGSGQPLDPGNPLIIGTYDEVTFEGGTGRFEHAAGSGDETGVFDFLTGDFEAETRGSIYYDASDRAER